MIGRTKSNAASRLRLFAELSLLALSRALPTEAQPVRYQAEYKQVYFDDVETVAPALSAGFVLDRAGTITSTPAEVIAGTHSIKGTYSATGSFTPYLRTLPSTVAFVSNQTYRVTFRYRIVTAPDRGFEILFFSPTAGAAGNFLPSVTITGPAGAEGSATLTNTLGPYSDYEARWNVVGTGAIAIDDIQITAAATGQIVASENAERLAPTVGPGIQLLNGASVVTDPAPVIAGRASLRLSAFGTAATRPTVVALSTSTTYIVEFQYRIIARGGGENVLYLWLQPAGTTDQHSSVSLAPLLKNAAESGTFSAGAETAAASSYVLNVSATADSVVLIDGITILQKSVIPTGVPPAPWAKLDGLPYPRLGKYQLGTSLWQAQAGGLAEGPAFRVSVEEVESTLAFADVIIGLEPVTQTRYPDSVRRLRRLNENVVILPYRVAEEQATTLPPPTDSDVDITFQFLQGIADDWYLRDSKGAYVPEQDYPFIRMMNTSAFCPTVNGNTYNTYLLDWLNEELFPSGLWDGLYFDNLFGRINPHILDRYDPALFDVDYNRNGLRDETPAAVSDLARSAAVGMLQQLRSRNGDLQLVIGSPPELSLAPYVNGFSVECANYSWNGSYLPNLSPAGWRMALDVYRTMEAIARVPRINLLEGCGPYATAPGGGYSAPTSSDIQNHRFTMGTTLLNNGFYWYDLHGSLSAPLWFDEYSVDSSGAAVKDRTKKGYLGQSLSDARELTEPGVLVFQEDFESGSLPVTFTSNPPGAASASRTASEVITGSGSLVVSNPDHSKQASVSANTDPAAVRLLASNSYLLTFDWRILETLDGSLRVDAFGNGHSLDSFTAPGIVAGDSGTAHIPLLVSENVPWTIRFAVTSGGGKVAIDNVRVYRGGVGPWRRDFENGFVLVNPLTQAHAFSAADLAGTFNRTGVRRIKGTQAPDVNNGQAVTGNLTLEPFDAIILLADHLTATVHHAAASPGPGTPVKKRH